ncbi:MAG: phytanoyl-CoA dioxygenase family protein [Pseudomonadota bacterium]
MSTASETLSDQGFVWFREALSSDHLAEIESYCAFGKRPGRRLSDDPALLSLLSERSAMGELIGAALPHAKPVRLVSFNKSQNANWAVPWHQDRVLAVREKHELPGYQNWTRQGDYWHVEPPEAVLQEMIFARIHFDAATHENGVMELASGTHKLGKVAAEQARSVAEMKPADVCEAAPGDVLLVKALTLHRSRSASKASQRRALRVDYAAFDLPAPLQWAIGAAVGCG